jgi:Do/DeqQ family serine protease
MGEFDMKKIDVNKILDMKKIVLIAALKIAVMLCFFFVSQNRAAAQEAAVPASVPQMQLSFAPLVKKAGPAVVNIYAKHVVEEQVRRTSPFSNDPFFNQFFNAPGFGGPVRERVAQSLGSGVIVGETGVIATNHHVIADATDIRVVLSDGREFTAQKLLDDPRTDITILKIDVKNEKLPVLQLADSDAVEVGDLVLAIGNPFGLSQTVTSGIVSALARTDIGISDYSFFIQTDASINPGNSGGALIDMQGRLIGINNAIYSKSGGSVGIGFAIPSNMVKTVIDAAQHGSTIHRPWTGMIGQTVTPDMVDSLKLKGPHGALTAKVTPGSPADRAGMKPGDVVLGINGKDVQDPLALKFRLAEVAIGSPIRLQVSRAGVLSEVTIMAEAAPETPPRDESLIQGANPLAGAVIDNISPALIEEMGTLSTDAGVVVNKVNGGYAARIGLQRSDIILAINGEKIMSVSQVKGVLARNNRQWQIQIRRGEQTVNLNVSQ